MKTGCYGTFVITWRQSEIGGEADAPPEFLRVGSSWLWRGEALRVDGPRDLLILRGPEGEAELRTRAARAIARLTGREPADAMPGPEPEDDPRHRTLSFSVTDGYDLWPVQVIEPRERGAAGRLLMFSGRLPPVDVELWVVSCAMPEPGLGTGDPGVICFAAGTMIDTPRGRRAVEALRPGDLIQTRDDGAQPLLWAGTQEIGGARLFAEPHLRPVRIRAGAWGIGRPDDNLLVSPEHRMLITGRAARALFNTDEVLVAARDLIDGRAVRVAHDLGAVRYVHLLFARHQILRANGIESESFHPAVADLTRVAPGDRAALFQAMPGLAADATSYGDFARRALDRAEAAILRHDLAA